MQYEDYPPPGLGFDRGLAWGSKFDPTTATPSAPSASAQGSRTTHEQNQTNFRESMQNAPSKTSKQQRMKRSSRYAENDRNHGNTPDSVAPQTQILTDTWMGYRPLSVVVGEMEWVRARGEPTWWLPPAFLKPEPHVPAAQEGPNAWKFSDDEKQHLPLVENRYLEDGFWSDT